MPLASSAAADLSSRLQPPTFGSSADLWGISSASKAVTMARMPEIGFLNCKLSSGVDIQYETILRSTFRCIEPRHLPLTFMST